MGRHSGVHLSSVGVGFKPAPTDFYDNLHYKSRNLLPD